MKQFCVCIFVSVFLFIGGLFCANAQDMIVLRDGNIIEAKVMEIHPSEIRYKRTDNLDGPMIIIPKDRVLSIKYKNGVVDIINESSASTSAAGTAGNERNQTNETNQAGSSAGQQPGVPKSLQTILNALPAIPIAGNNLKFRFSGEKWTATVNGENFSAGTVEVENNNGGSILTLKQTHIWPGAVGKTAGRVAKIIPGGAAVGGALDAAGQVAGAVGAVEATGPEIILEYKAGPPAKLSLVKSAAKSSTATAKAAATSSDKQTTDSNDMKTVAVKLSFGLLVSIFGFEGTEEYYDSDYVNSYGATYISIINPILSLRLLSPLENKLRLGIGVDLAYSLAMSKIDGDGLMDMMGSFPIYGIIGYENSYLHLGYDFSISALYISPSFTIGKHFMICVPMSLLGSNQNIGFVSLYDPPNQSTRWGEDFKKTSKFYQVGISFQYVF